MGFDDGAEYRQKAVVRVRRLIERDGYTLTDDGLIRHQVTKPFTELPLEELRDPAVLYRHLGPGAADLPSGFLPW